MLSIEGVGRNIEKAIDNALLDLRAKREDVDIKILDEGGIFKKAKVLVTISEDCRDKYSKKSKVENPEDIEKIDVKAMFAELKKESENDKISAKTLIIDKKQTKIERTEKTDRDKVNKNKLEKKSQENIKKEKVTAKDFIKGLFKEASIEGNVFVKEDKEKINISIEGGNSGDLIGHRGECLNAIQYISSIVENSNSETRKRVVVDIENYRSRREESLKGLANRIAKKVEKTNKSIKLEPMNANERRIIHSELHKSSLVSTISKGTEPNRFLIVMPKKEEVEEIIEIEN